MPEWTWVLGYGGLNASSQGLTVLVQCGFMVPLSAGARVSPGLKY